MNRIAGKRDDTLIEVQCSGEDNNGCRLQSFGEEVPEHEHNGSESSLSCSDLEGSVHSSQSSDTVCVQCERESSQPNHESFHQHSSYSGIWRRRALFLKYRSRVDKQQQSKDSVFFRDGVRRIDFVLSYVDDEDKDGEKKQERRKVYEANLQVAGLQLETEDKSESEDGKTYFLKIHAPWDVLAEHAEILKIKVPFKASDIPEHRDVPMSWLFTPFRLPPPVMHPEPDYFTSPFDKNKTDFFLIDDKDTLFPPSTRNRIVRSRC